MSRALEHTKRVLFQPFELNKWLIMGFAAFLISPLGEGGGGGPSLPGGGGGGGSPPGGGDPGGLCDGLIRAVDWSNDNAFLVVLTVLGSIIVIGGLGVLFLWLASRGRFILLDDVAMDRAMLVEPWQRFRREANALLAAEITLAIIGGFTFAGSLVGALLLAWPDVESCQLGSGVLAGVALLAAVALPVGLVVGALQWLLHDFALPVMILRGGTAWRALGVVWRELVKPNAGAVVVYALLRILLAFGIGIVATVLGICTCCVAALPYVSSVVLLPATVFVRAWSLFFIEQLGPEWKIIAGPAAAPPPDHGEPWR